MPKTLPFAALLLSSLLALPPAARAEPVSAAAAAQRLQQGAQVWDIRSEAAAQRLPGAVPLALDGLQETEALARAVSAAGLDLSRDVLIYGEPGDARAQALHARLARLASGRADWLVGGLAEWQMSGRQLVGTPTRRLPVPQHLVARDAPDGPARMAAAALRDPAVPAGVEADAQLAAR